MRASLVEPVPFESRPRSGPRTNPSPVRPKGLRCSLQSIPRLLIRGQDGRTPSQAQAGPKSKLMQSNPSPSHPSPRWPPTQSKPIQPSPPQPKPVAQTHALMSKPIQASPKSNPISKSVLGRAAPHQPGHARCKPTRKSTSVQSRTARANPRESYSPSSLRSRLQVQPSRASSGRCC